MFPRISTVIINFNYARYLPRSIESVLRQSSASFEILVIDSGSTDSSLSIIDQYSSRGVRCISNKLGSQTTSRNLALSLATGDWIAFLDADDSWHPDKLKLQASKCNEGVAIVASKIRIINEKQNLSEIIEPPFDGNIFDKFYKFPTTNLLPGGESCALLNLKMLRDISGFNPILNSSAGRDAYRRISKLGTLKVVNEVLVDVHIHGTNMSSNVMSGLEDSRRGMEIMISDSDYNLSKKRVYLIKIIFFKSAVLKLIKMRKLKQALTWIISTLYTDSIKHSTV